MTCQSTVAPWQFRGLVPPTFGTIRLNFKNFHIDSLNIGNVSIGPIISVFFELIGLDFFDSLEKHLKIGIGTNFLGISHIVAVHQKKKPYVCDKCGKEFSQKSWISLSVI